MSLATKMGLNLPEQKGQPTQKINSWRDIPFAGTPGWAPTSVQTPAQPAAPATPAQPVAQPADNSLSTEQLVGAKQGASVGLARLQMPEMPKTIKTPTAVEETNAKQEQQSVLDDLIPTVSPEEQQQRQRSAAAVQGVAALGKGITALSNLIFAGQAPSQTLPQVPDESGTQVMSWQDRLQSQRLQRNALEMQMEQERIKAANDAWQRAMTESQQKWQQSFQERQQQWQQQYQEQQGKQAQQRLDLEEARVRQAQQRLDNASTGSGRGTPAAPAVEYTYDVNDFSSANREKIAAAIGRDKAIAIIGATNRQAAIDKLTDEEKQKLAQAGIGSVAGDTLDLTEPDSGVLDIR